MSEKKAPSVKKIVKKPKDAGAKSDQPTASEVSEVAQDVAKLLGTELPAEQGVEEEAVEEDAEVEEEDTRNVLRVFSSKCVKCLHLCETGDKAYTSCFHENGNDYCPAKELRIIIGVPVDKVAQILYEATLAGDAERLSTTYAKLAEKDESVQKEVADLFRKKMATA